MTALCGFTKLINKLSQSFLISLVRLMYASRDSTGQMLGSSRNLKILTEMLLLGREVLSIESITNTFLRLSEIKQDNLNALIVRILCPVLSASTTTVF